MIFANAMPVGPAFRKLLHCRLGQREICQASLKSARAKSVKCLMMRGTQHYFKTFWFIKVRPPRAACAILGVVGKSSWSVLENDERPFAFLEANQGVSQGAFSAHNI